MGKNSSQQLDLTTLLMEHDSPGRVFSLGFYTVENHLHCVIIGAILSVDERMSFFGHRPTLEGGVMHFTCCADDNIFLCYLETRILPFPFSEDVFIFAYWFPFPCGWLLDSSSQGASFMSEMTFTVILLIFSSIYQCKWSLVWVIVWAGTTWPLQILLPRRGE